MDGDTQESLIIGTKFINFRVFDTGKFFNELLDVSAANNSTMLMD